ncbi:MAG TPA: radical SAM protein [Candidatus Goldiibacteriota bacterium]|nr:radical SAM protein [Candidatus Goldiibacteriota bacterium]
MVVNEVFYDIEGEGKYQGYASLFIRLAGCGLRCKWCDTGYARLKGSEMSVARLVSVVKKSPYKYLNVTGGEPLEQRHETISLIKMAKKTRPDITVSVETNGAQSIKGVPADNISMDLKLPSSGEHEKMLLSNLRLLKPKDQLKLVAGSAADLRYAKKILSKHKVKAPVFVQPVFNRLALAAISRFVLDNRLEWKVSAQLHKI